MTTLAANIDATQTLIPVDAGLTNGSFQYPLYFTADSEAIRVVGRAIETTWLVDRGIAGTTAASHLSAATLTRYYPDSASTGAGGSLTIDNLSDDPEEVSTLVMGATFGPAGTATVDSISTVDIVSSAFATVSVAAQEDGTAQVSNNASAQLDGASTVIATATATEGAATVQNTATSPDGPALVSNLATSTSGTATARLDATSGTGDSESRVAVISGATVLAGVVASHVDGVGDSLDITDGNGLAGTLADVGAVLTQDATVGSKWVANDPLTSAGAIVISAAAAANVLTLGADGSLEHNGSGVVRVLGLPTADPVVAGQLWNDAGTLKVSAG